MAGVDTFPHWVVGRDALGTYRAILLLLLLLAHQEPDGKNLLLKIPQTLVTGRGKIKLVLTKKHPPLW